MTKTPPVWQRDPEGKGEFAAAQILPIHCQAGPRHCQLLVVGRGSTGLGQPLLLPSAQQPVPPLPWGTAAWDPQRVSEPCGTRAFLEVCPMGG